MIVRNLTEKQHAGLSVFLVIAIIIFIGAILVVPALSMRKSFNDQFEELSFQYSRFSKLQLQRDRITSELEYLRQQQSDSSGFLVEKEKALAAADLTSYINKIIESNVGNRISTQLIQHETNDIFPDVKINIRMQANIESLQEIFYALETDQITMLIDNVYLQKRNRRLNRRTARTQSPVMEDGLIEARFEVTGYIYRTDTES